ncbi:HNH endonuclease [Paenibacillus sp. SYP-B3998]|uniref:HNH endonuclease n=1 Tax=Paenibacillus sp. SYP-B3998 TaxID=2678564 RepID=A0A6G4A7L3_9BACL|nr:HNH endonuclease [Paenibacillus sp. SYP-B3998]NEW09934.1 HNH endonuclease [Paenibacillus sp. SYP-B3998]
MKYKEGWTETERAEANAKVKALTEANTIKTPSQRGGTSAFARYKKANGADAVPPGKDVDHSIDLKLGGADDILNMNPLDRSVNRSLGKQIQNKIKDYPYGTIFDKFKIGD